MVVGLDLFRDFFAEEGCTSNRCRNEHRES